jgi:hypothetical protein
VCVRDETIAGKGVAPPGQIETDWKAKYETLLAKVKQVVEVEAE